MVPVPIDQNVTNKNGNNLKSILHTVDLQNLLEKKTNTKSLKLLGNVTTLVEILVKLSPYKCSGAANRQN